MKDNKYKIILTKRQLQLLSYVCEMMSRQICGQLEISLQLDCETAYIRNSENGNVGSPEWYAMREEVERHIDELRELCWKQGKGSSYGIHYDETADILWDMHQVFRHELWKNKPQDKRSIMTVDADKPLHIGIEPLAKCERIIKHIEL